MADSKKKPAKKKKTAPKEALIESFTNVHYFRYLLYRIQNFIVEGNSIFEDVVINASVRYTKKEVAQVRKEIEKLGGDITELEEVKAQLEKEKEDLWKSKKYSDQAYTSPDTIAS